jgi:hypothetical protein
MRTSRLISLAAFWSACTGTVIGPAVMSGHASAAPPSVDTPPPVATLLAEVNRDFTYRSQPINPRAVKELESGLADSVPGPVAVDLEGTWHSNRYYGEFARRADGSVYIDMRTTVLTPPPDNLGWYAYKRLGTLASGVHVLETWDNGGGTGIFTNLLLVRFTIDQELSYDGRRQRLVMLRVGECVLGDRYDGEVLVKGNTVEIGADRYRYGARVKGRVLNLDWLR